MAVATIMGSRGLRTFLLLHNVGQLQSNPWYDTHSLTLGRLLHSGFLNLSTINIFGTDESWLWWAVLCTVGFLAASLISTQ